MSEEATIPDDLIEIDFTNIKPTDAIREFAKERIQRFHKYIPYAVQVHVMLSVENRTHTAEMTCHAEHQEYIGTGKSEDLYSSIDDAVHKIESQLRKDRDKRKGQNTAHRFARATAEEMATDVDAHIPHQEKKG